MLQPWELSLGGPRGTSSKQHDPLPATRSHFVPSLTVEISRDCPVAPDTAGAEITGAIVPYKDSSHL